MIRRDRWGGFGINILLNCLLNIIFFIYPFFFYVCVFVCYGLALTGISRALGCLSHSTALILFFFFICDL